VTLSDGRIICIDREFQHEAEGAGERLRSEGAKVVEYWRLENGAEVERMLSDQEKAACTCDSDSYCPPCFEDVLVAALNGCLEYLPKDSLALSAAIRAISKANILECVAKMSSKDLDTFIALSEMLAKKS